LKGHHFILLIGWEPYHQIEFRSKVIIRLGIDEWKMTCDDANADKRTRASYMA